MPTKNEITVLTLLTTWITVHATARLASQLENQTDIKNRTTLYKCAAGRTGLNCSEECKVGSYGKDCAFNCSMHCKYKSCNPEIGNCTYGCEYGWDGVYCEEDILTPEELQEQAIIMFFQFVGGIMGFYLLQIAFIKYRSLNLGCCCCCKYCPCNREKRKRKKMRQLQKQKPKEANFMVELEPLKCDNKCSNKQVVHVV